MSFLATLYGRPPEFTGTVRTFDESYYDKPEVKPLEMSAQAFKILRSRQEVGKNKTEKADAVYLDALKDGPLTAKDLSQRTHRTVNTVQRAVRMMEARGLIKQAGIIKTKANPPILWGLK